MAAKSSVPAVMDYLKPALEARPGMDGVLVRTGMLGDTRGRNCLELWGVEAENDWRKLGNQRIEEKYEITGAIWAYVRGVHDQESAIKQVRDDAFGIYDELLECVREDPRLGANVTQSIPNEYEFVQGYDSEQRVARIEFTIRVENSITS